MKLAHNPHANQTKEHLTKEEQFTMAGYTSALDVSVAPRQSLSPILNAMMISRKLKSTWPRCPWKKCNSNRGYGAKGGIVDAMNDAADRLETHDLEANQTQEHLTKEAQFTVAAMQGLCANPLSFEALIGSGKNEDEQFAAIARISNDIAVATIDKLSETDQ